MMRLSDSEMHCLLVTIANECERVERERLIAEDPFVHVDGAPKTDYADYLAAKQASAEASALVSDAGKSYTELEAAVALLDAMDSFAGSSPQLMGALVLWRAERAARGA